MRSGTRKLLRAKALVATAKSSTETLETWGWKSQVGRRGRTETKSDNACKNFATRKV